MKTKHFLGLLCAGLLYIPLAAAFTDTDSSVHEQAIDTLYEEGILEGYSDGSFRPNASINRAEFVKVLMEALHPGESEGTHCFSDVSTDWYAKYVCTAHDLKVVDGYLDGSFKPSNAINLAEALKILLETYLVPTCKDCDELWYEPYFSAAQDLNLLDGVSLDPAHELTRGEMAQLIYTLIDEEEVVQACEEQLFGFWGLNGNFEGDIVGNLENMKGNTDMNAFVVATSPDYAVKTQLPAVEEADLTAAFRMSGGNAELIDSMGNFSLSAWKDLFDTWADAEIDPYLGDELLWHMMLDDIDTFDNEFGGENPTAEELAEMAKYSKNLFPGLKTLFRHDAYDMPSGDYPYLDAVINQYATRKGSLSDYISRNLEALDELDVDVIWGLNIVDGGDGSSGHPGLSTDKFIMSPQEIEEYGKTLLQLPNSLGLLMWEYDADQKLADGYTSAERFSTEAYQEVFKYLATFTNCD